MIKLQQGDYVMQSDIADEAMHNEIREAFHAAGCSVEENQGEYAGCDRKNNCIFWGSHFLGWGREDLNICQRRVYPDDILKKQTLFDAAKDAHEGAKFAIGNDKFVKNMGNLIWVEDSGHSNFAPLVMLSATDFETIPDGPKKRDVRMAPVALQHSVMVPEDYFADVIPAITLIGKLMQWEGAQIGKPGYRTNGVNGIPYFVDDAVIPIDVTFETADQCEAAWKAECLEMFK
jgi:hypothetical protein